MRLGVLRGELIQGAAGIPLIPSPG
jgi:hypothetical protein